VRLPAFTLFYESDFAELPQAPEGMAKIPPGNGARTALVDQVGERCCGKETPVAPQDVPNEFQHAFLPAPFHIVLEGICQPRDWAGLAWSGLGLNNAGGVGCPQQAVNGVDPAAPLRPARAQLGVALPLKPSPPL
jgi:hypothetical protein